VAVNHFSKNEVSEVAKLHLLINVDISTFQCNFILDFRSCISAFCNFINTKTHTKRRSNYEKL